ncbi:MAG: amidohydrolase family protein [Phycisphaerales bacterium]|nr:MAG: amidohydrolase family protein [Phycisphaerales bacterium]
MTVTTTASAQDLGLKAPTDARSIAIVGGDIHTISSGTIEKGVVHMQGGIIKDVFTPSEWDFYKATIKTNWGQWEIVNAEGKHVYPGLIGAWSQMGLTEFQAIDQSNDTNETGWATPETIAATAVNPDSTLIPVTRSNGVLLSATYPSGGTISGRASVIRMDGWTMPELAIETRWGRSVGLVVNWPNVRPVRAWWMRDNEEEQKKRIEETLRKIGTFFDQAAAYARAVEADPTTPKDLRFEAMRPIFPEAAKALGVEAMPVLVSAGEVDQITHAVNFFAERGVRVVLVGGRDAPLCADLIKRANVSVIVLGTFSVPRRDDSAYDEAYTLPARLADAGIEFAIASGDDTAHERNLPYNAAMAACFGLDQDVALRSITLAPAKILGLDATYGSIEKGKSATLIVADGPILEITSSVTAAFIDGRRIDLSNKQTVLAEKYRERYRQMKRADENSNAKGTNTPARKP